MSKSSLLQNFSWKFAERIAAQLITLIVSLILARLLDPSDYGIVSIVTILITLANVLVSDGFGSALIQKKDADALDFFSVTYFNIAFSVVLYVILFVGAPFITAFYGEGYEQLTAVIRVLGLRVILSGVNSVQQAYVSRKMIFRNFFWATLIGTVLSAIVGIAMALTGFGVWALVAQYLTNTTVGTICLAILIKKKPRLMFSATRLKGLLQFGSKILGANLLITGYQEVRALIIGKVYSTADLAYYDRGKQFPNLVVTNINSSISAVLFPKIANEQDDISKVQDTTRMAIRFSSYIMSPLMLGLAVVAEPLIRLILTEKWLPCVPLLQLFCIIYLFQPIHTANMQAIKAIGRSDIYLKLEIIKKVIELIVLLCVMWHSVEAIVVGMAVLTTLFTFVNAYPNSKLLQYTFAQQLRDISPAIGMSAVMAAAAWLVTLLPVGSFVMLTVQVIVGAAVYIALSVLTKNKEFYYVLAMLRSMLRK